MADRGWSGWVRYGLPGLALALGLGLAWGLGDRGPSARAQGLAGSGPAIPLPASTAERPRGRASAEAPSSGSSSGTIALTAPAGGSAQYLFLVDTRAGALAVYKVDPSNPKGTIKLEAARRYEWDLKLEHYNNLDPMPAAIEAAVKSTGSTTR
jgi:hypothetical protein